MFNRRGQNIAEYSILIALVIAAAVAMQTYVKRGLQGRVKDAVDTKGQAVTLDSDTGTTLTFSGQQYEPYYQDSNTEQTSSKNTNEVTAANGQIGRTLSSDTQAVKAGSYEQSLSTDNAD